MSLVHGLICMHFGLVWVMWSFERKLFSSLFPFLQPKMKKNSERRFIPSLCLSFSRQTLSRRADTLTRGWATSCLTSQFPTDTQKATFINLSAIQRKLHCAHGAEKVSTFFRESVEVLWGVASQINKTVYFNAICAVQSVLCGII